MSRLKQMSAVLFSLLLVLAGCSMRPVDGTYQLESDATSQSSQSAFDLKEVKLQSIAQKNLVGWQGNALLLYDSAGLYSFRYDTAALTPLLSVSDGRLLYAEPSGNGKKIAYQLLDSRNKYPIYLSDADGKTDAVNLSDRFGISWKTFAWSNGGRYLYSRTPQASGTNVLDVSAQAPVALKIKGAQFTTIHDLDDSSGELLLSQFQDQSNTLYLAGFDALRGIMQTADGNSGVFSQYLALFAAQSAVQTAGDSLAAFSQASFIGGGRILVLSDGTLSIMEESQPKQKQSYSDIVKYGVSADHNDICLVKTNASGSFDIYVGSLQDGGIVNQTLLYKGFEPTPAGIFFSPDDKKIAIRGYKKEALSDGTVMVLTLR